MTKESSGFSLRIGRSRGSGEHEQFFFKIHCILADHQQKSLIISD
jgi:hypothetical protein